jgi:regulator of sigma E protease
VNDPSRVIDPKLTVLAVAEKSPAQKAGLTAGDKITSIESLDTSVSDTNLTAEKFTGVIRSTPAGVPVHLHVIKIDKSIKDYLIIPETGISGDYRAIGVSVDQVGMYKEGFFKSIGSGFINTVHVTGDTAKAFAHLIAGAFKGPADVKSLTGPVGLVSVVHDAQKIGAVYVIMLMALISVNLAVLNLIPFPALDGGRILVVIIEAVTRRKIKPAIVQWVNGIGFLLLIALMIFITVKDVIKLF